MEITNGIKAKVFAQNLGQRVVSDDGTTGIIDRVSIYEKEFLEVYGSCKLIKKPLSDITGEDAVEVAKIVSEKCNVDIFVNRQETLVVMNTNGYKMVTIFFDGTIMYKDLDGVDCYTLKTLQAYQYLQSKGYDLPNFLLGGKTLHESGLAIYEK